MTLASRFLLLCRRVVVRAAPTRNRCVAAGVFCLIAFAGAGAWGQALFIYRDLDTAIRSDASESMSLRYMRHVWITSDSVFCAVLQKGGYEGHGLALYKSLDEGGTWTLEQVLSTESNTICDGVLDADNNLLFVTSFIAGNLTTDIQFIKMIYQPGAKSWTIDPLTPVTVLTSNALRKLSRASLSVDSNGVIWCAFRSQFVYLGIPGLTHIKMFYSADGGYTWTDSDNKFGTTNRLAQKSAKVISVGSRTVVIYQDMQIVQSDTLRFKSWGYRDDNQPLGDTWTDAPISQMLVAQDDTLGSHWSVAADEFGNLHLSYQDAGIRYLRYDAASDTWQEPQLITTYDGTYNNISVAANNDLYLFNRFVGSLKVFCKQYSVASQRWSRWLAMSSGPHPGFLRMSSPERFLERLPVLYEVSLLNPHTILYVLFDTYQVTNCR